MVENKNIDINYKRRLFQKILDDIKNGSATIQDYNDYEKILIESGVKKEKIVETLSEHKLKTWEAYIAKRKKANTYQKKRETDAIIAGALIGLGTAALIMLLSDD